jgi:hypothetical protein
VLAGDSKMVVPESVLVPELVPELVPVLVPEDCPAMHGQFLAIDGTTVSQLTARAGLPVQFPSE